jgi:hypothetical protein
MGFLKNFFRNVFREEDAAQIASSFAELSEEELEAHLRVCRYGDFLLTNAIRPSYNLQVVPKQGFRHDVYKDEQSKSSVPVLMGAVTKQRVFETFIEMLDPLGNSVDVVLETSHHRDSRGHMDLYREHIDLPVLKSILYDYEEMLTNDGCTGIAVLNPQLPQEVQFDEHKLLIVYGNDLSAYERVFNEQSVHCDDSLRFITEAEHVHSSNEEYLEQFEELRMRLGIDIAYHD